MTHQEDINTEVSTDIVAPAVEPTVTLSTEDLARAEGWVPLEEFKGNKDNFADAKEFLRVGKLIKSRDEKALKLERELKDLKNITKSMLTTMQKSEKDNYEKAYKDLEAKFQSAKRSGDVDEAFEIKTKQDEITTQLKELEKQQQTKGQEVLADPVFQKFQEKHNFWLAGTDRSAKLMRQLASEISAEYAANNKNASLEDELKHVEEELRKEFPQRFKDTLQDTKSVDGKKSSSSPVLSSSSSKPDTGSFSRDNLTPAERSIVEYLKLKGYDYKAYVKALKK